MAQHSAVKASGDPGEGGVAVGGSLGKLLASYGNSSEEEEEGDLNLKGVSTNSAALEEPPPTWTSLLLPNRVFEPVAIKAEKEDGAEGGEHGDGSTLINSAEVEMNKIRGEKEPPMDFGGIRENHEKVKMEDKKVDMLELDVDDFLGPSDPYKEARQVKEEVHSGTSDSEQDSESGGEETSEDEYEQSVAGGKDKKGRKKPEGPRVKGEFRLSDLPPIEDLHISVSHEECKPIGVIKSVVEPLVIVEALLDTPALDLDSVLFLDEGDRALGHIFDVIGPVKQPLYCVRFNSMEHIEKNKIEVGMAVYCAPKTPYTTYVFLAQLKRLKGSDASWCNDIEPPPEEVEYSDDEQERLARKKKKNRKKKPRPPPTDAEPVEGHQELPSRGQKRHYNQNPPGAPHQAPFVPPIVPGFFPPNYNPWNHFQNPPRGPPPRGYRGSHRFRGARPPPPQNPDHFSNLHQGPPHQWTYNGGAPPPPDPWRCPNQWQNQIRPSFNFSPPQQQNPYMFCRLPPPPPPPPPPSSRPVPPPGEY